MKRSQAEADEGMESFLDIITNVIGIMILIAAAVVMSTAKLTVEAGTPRLRPAPDGATWTDYYCIGNRVIYLDEDGIIDDVKNALKEHEKKIGYRLDTPGIIEWVNEREFGDESFAVSLYAFQTGYGALYKLRVEDQGETHRDIESVESEFRRRLANLDSKKDVIGFWVCEDSFRVYRRANAIARELGFQTNWFPRKKREYPDYDYSGFIGENDVN